jgi:hypothetical protein
MQRHGFDNERPSRQWAFSIWCDSKLIPGSVDYETQNSAGFRIGISGTTGQLRPAPERPVNEGRSAFWKRKPSCSGIVLAIVRLSLGFGRGEPCTRISGSCRLVLARPLASLNAFRADPFVSLNLKTPSPAHCGSFDLVCEPPDESLSIIGGDPLTPSTDHQAWDIGHVRAPSPIDSWGSEPTHRPQISSAWG